MKRWVNRENGFWQSLKMYGELDSGTIVVFCSGYNVHAHFLNLQKRGLACREPVIFQARYPGFPYYNPTTPCRECSTYSPPGGPLRSSGGWAQGTVTSTLFWNGIHILNSLQEMGIILYTCPAKNQNQNKSIEVIENVKEVIRNLNCQKDRQYIVLTKKDKKTNVDS